MKNLLLAALAGLVLGCTHSHTHTAAPDNPRGAQDVADDVRMAAAHADDSPSATPAATAARASEVIEERIAYGDVGGSRVYGYLARPKGARRSLPALIVIHEWWGLNDDVRDEARHLAAEGYVTLAVDLYNGQTATEPPAAARLSGNLTRNTGPAEENLRQAYAYLEQTVGAPRIGAIGWCLGGRWSLRTALLLPDKLDATVIYYGSVQVPEAELATLQMPVLGLFAENDIVVKLPTVLAFQETMARLGKEAEIKVYPGTEHAFANPSSAAYQQAAADDAWQRTLAFLRRNLADGS